MKNYKSLPLLLWSTVCIRCRCREWYSQGCANQLPRLHSELERGEEIGRVQPVDLMEPEKMGGVVL